MLQPAGPSAELTPYAETVAITLVCFAIDAISAHYGMDVVDVRESVARLSQEMECDTGLPHFGRLFERPCGFTALGICVARDMFGSAYAEEFPHLVLSFH